MSLALHEPKQVARQSNSNTASEQAPQVEYTEIIDFVCKTANERSGGTNSKWNAPLSNITPMNSTLYEKPTPTIDSKRTSTTHDMCNAYIER